MLKSQKLTRKLLDSCLNKNIKLITAESCTGGLLSANITEIAGSSAVFSHGIICYSNQSKRKFLNVDEATLKSHGAVSFETVKEMLSGLCNHAESKALTIAISGVAGPSGSESKPVGLVFIGIRVGKRVIVNKCNFKNKGRIFIQKQTVRKALNLLAKLIIRDS